MNIDSINKWLSVAANVGVLIGIVFLSLEISQSTRVSTGTTEGEIRERFIELGNTVLNNQEFAATWSKLTSRNPELTETEKSQLFIYARNYWVFFVSVETAFNNGLITEETFGVFLNILPQSLRANPGFAPFFVDLLDSRSLVADNRMSIIANEVLEDLGVF